MIIRDIQLSNGEYVKRFVGQVFQVSKVDISDTFEGDVSYITDVNILLDNDAFGFYFNRVFEDEVFINYSSILLYVLSDLEIQFLSYIENVKLVRIDTILDTVGLLTETCDNYYIITKAWTPKDKYWTILREVIALFKSNSLTIVDNSFYLEFYKNYTVEYTINTSWEKFNRFLTKVITLSGK